MNCHSIPLGTDWLHTHWNEMNWTLGLNLSYLLNIKITINIFKNKNAIAVVVPLSVWPPSQLWHLFIEVLRNIYLCRYFVFMWCYKSYGIATWSEPACLIQRPLLRKIRLIHLDVENCSKELLPQQSFAIKNQLGHPKPPTRGFGTQNTSYYLGVFACSSLVLYGIRIVGFHARKGPIIGALMP